MRRFSLIVEVAEGSVLSKMEGLPIQVLQGINVLLERHGARVAQVIPESAMGDRVRTLMSMVRIREGKKNDGAVEPGKVADVRGSGAGGD